MSWHVYLFSYDLTTSIFYYLSFKLTHQQIVEHVAKYIVYVELYIYIEGKNS